MEPLIPQLAAAGITIAFCLFLGYGAARLLLPAALTPWFWVLAPVVGYAVHAVASGWLSMLLPMQAVAWALVVAAIVINATILFRTGGKLTPPGQAWLEQSALSLLGVAGCLAALTPLWNRPELLTIGPNWDIEIYIPMATYLKEFATGFSFANPAGFPFPTEPNPLLWRVDFFDPRWSGLSFAQLHGITGTLTGQQPHQDFPAILAAIMGLSVLGSFPFLRIAFGLPRIPSLIVCGFLAASPVMLYTIYWSFGQQSSVFPLFPLALLSAVQALQTPSWRWLALAGLFLAAMMASFIPVIPLFALAAGCSALGLAFKSPFRGVFLRGLGIVLLSALLVPWAYLRGAKRLYHFWDEGGTTGLTAGPDVIAFPQASWLLGLAGQPQSLASEHAGQASVFLAAILPALSVVFLALIAIGLVWLVQQHRPEVGLIMVGALVLLLAFRTVAPYPYGFLKVLPHIQFLVLGLAAVGIWTGWRWLRGRAPQLLLRAGALGGGVLLVGLTIFNLQALIVTTRAQSYTNYRAMEGLRTLVPQGASVFISGDKSYEGPKAAALTYFLRHASLYGYVRTGFSAFYRPPEHGRTDFAVFGDVDPIPEELYQPGQLVWQGQGIRLYRSPHDLVVYQNFGWPASPPTVKKTAGYGAAAGILIDRWLPSGYPDFQGWSPPLLGVLSETDFARPLYPVVQPASSLSLALPQGTGTVTTEITLAALTTTNVLLDTGSSQTEVTLSPGVSSQFLQAAGAAQELNIRNDGPGTVYAKSIAQWNGAHQTAPGQPAGVVARWRAAATERGMTIDLDYLSSNFQPVLDVYSKDGARHLGYWQLPKAVGASLTTSSRFDSGTQSFVLADPRQQLDSWKGETGDGRYVAYLFLWNGERLRSFVPLCEFTIKNGAVIDVSQTGSVFIG